MKQLELFGNLTKEIPKDELQKLKGLAASADQDNISICCTMLGVYNWSFNQKAAFVFEAQLNTIEQDEWIEFSVCSGKPVERSFKIGSTFFKILDGELDVNMEQHLIVCKDNTRYGVPLYTYTNWLTNDDKDRPTTKSRAIQVQYFKKLLKYWERCKQQKK